MNKELRQWQGLVYNIVNRYRKNTFKYKTYIDWDEVEQAGMIGLWNAIKKYNPDKGTFKNYAITAIKREIVRQLNKDREIETHIDIEPFSNIFAEEYNTDDCIDLSQLKSKLIRIINSMENSLQSKDILISNLLGESIGSISKRLNVSHQYISKLLSENNKIILQRYKGVHHDNRE